MEPLKDKINDCQIDFLEKRFIHRFSQKDLADEYGASPRNIQHLERKLIIKLIKFYKENISKRF